MSKENEKLRVWIYTRLRKSEQELIARQVQLAQAAKGRDYSIVGLSMDDHGGWPFRRPGLKEALHSIQNGDVDALLVTRMGKISHDDRILYSVFKALQNHGAKLLTTDYQLEYRLNRTWLEHKLRQRARRWHLSVPW